MHAATVRPAQQSHSALVVPQHLAIRGRARLAIKGLKRSDCGAGADQLRNHLAVTLAEQREILALDCSLLSGCVLVRFSPQVPVARVVTLVEEAVRNFWSRWRPASEIPARTVAPKSTRTTGREQGRRDKHVAAPPQSSPPWHALPWQAACEAFAADPLTGLSQAQADLLRQRFGPNLLPQNQPRSAWRILLDQIKSPAMLLLAGSAVLSAATGGLADGLVILSAVVINSIIGLVTETQTEKIIHSLQRMVQPLALVIRGGIRNELDAAELVPGDLVVLQPGSLVAADCRLLEARQLTVDESALTGESFPVAKTVMPISTIETPLADRNNMAFMGTMVTGGQGLALVVATGAMTELGGIQALVGASKPPPTPMEKELNRLGNQLVLASSAVCAAVFAIGLLRGYGLLPMIKNSITLAVAAVPEGLPTVATTILALGVRRMRQHQVLIRHIDAVEALGSVQTLCLDKTGTITRNQMTVRRIETGNCSLRIEPGENWQEQYQAEQTPYPELTLLFMVLGLCNEANTDDRNDHGPATGTPTEIALLQATRETGIDTARLRHDYPLLAIRHRSEQRLFMETVHDLPAVAETRCFERMLGQETVALALSAVKGSPTEVMGLCNHILCEGEIKPLTTELRERLELINENMAASALRVLGVAYGLAPRPGLLANQDPPKNLVWLGLAGMSDPIRPGVSEVIGRLHRAGIQTVMITGDQIPTAYAIGKELNLSQGRQLEVLESRSLQSIEPSALQTLVGRVQVFARVTPAQKLEIVQALQGSGQIVAMTGDGINDGPALKAADIGVAMGSAGTDVAREIADVVLENDDLDTLILAVAQGRTICNNIRKSIHYLFATNMSEIMAMFSAVALGLGQPLNPMQLLWINLISDIFPGLALSMEEPEPDLLERPPRDPRQPLISNRDLRRMGLEAAAMTGGAMGAYGYGLLRYGQGPRAGTMAFMTLSLTQILHGLSCRSDQPVLFRARPLPGNPYLTGALGGSLLLQLMAALTPGLRSFLGLAPLTLADALVVGTGTILPLLFNETSKPTLGEATDEKGLHVPLGIGHRGASGQALRPDQRCHRRSIPAARSPGAHPC